MAGSPHRKQEGKTTREEKKNRLNPEASDKSSPHNEKKWIVCNLVTGIDVPYVFFSSSVCKVLFWLAGLGDITINQAVDCTHDEALHVKERLSYELKILRKKGAVFSMTADQWTRKSKCYLAMTLHCSEIIPTCDSRFIEMVRRLHGRVTAEVLKEALSKSLKQLGMSLSDIQAITTDGAGVMLKLGKMLHDAAKPRPFYHQLCLTDGIHLAVLESLHGIRHRSVDQTNETFLLARNPDESVIPKWVKNSYFTLSEHEDEADMYLDESEEESPMVDPFDMQDPSLPFSVWEVLRKVRSLCTKFVARPAKSNALEKICAELKLPVLQVIIDTRIRWNSTLQMLQRFLELVKPLRIYYIQKNKELPFTHDEITAIKTLVTALECVERAALRISEDDLNLYKADRVLETLIEEMGRYGEFGAKLRGILCHSLYGRRGIASKCARFIQDRARVSHLDRSIQAYNQDNAEVQVSLPPPNASINNELQSLFVEYLGTPFGGGQTLSQEERDFAMGHALFIIKLHELCPEFESEIFGATVIDTIIPTIVPAERCFAKIRHHKMFSQGLRAENRFSDDLLLKDVYAKTKRAEAWWEQYAASPKKENQR